MKTKLMMLLTGLAAAGFLVGYAICDTRCRRSTLKREKDDLSRWEGEGGPPAPDMDMDGAEPSAA
jgi:hypothetical protein